MGSGKEGEKAKSEGDLEEEERNEAERAEEEEEGDDLSRMEEGKEDGELVKEENSRALEGLRSELKKVIETEEWLGLLLLVGCGGRGR